MLHLLLCASIVSARTASSSCRRPVCARPALAQRPTETSTPAAPQPPANDTATPEAPPVYALTDARRAGLRKRALKLVASSLRATPPRLAARVAWMGGVHAMAWRDREAMFRLTLDEEPITREELDAFGYLVEYLREFSAQRGFATEASAEEVAPDADADPAEMSDASLLEELRAQQSTLRRALVMRFTAVKTVRRTLAATRRGRYLPSALRSGTLLLTLSERRGIERWLRGLPRGEGQALDRLRALHAEGCRRDRARKSDAHEVRDTELVARLWTLAQPTLARLLRAGRYLTDGTPAQGRAYKGFRTPSRAKKQAATPKPQPVDGAPVAPR